MESKHIPLDDLGGSGVFPLMAEALSSPSGDRECGKPRSKIAAAGEATAIERLMTATQARDSYLVNRPLYTRYAPGLTSEAGRAITRSGMWSGAGFVGASMLASGLLMLGAGGTNAGIALALILAGGAAAAYGWRKAWQVLDGVGHDASPAPTCPSAPAGPGGARGEGTVALRIARAHPRTAFAGR